MTKLSDIPFPPILDTSSGDDSLKFLHPVGASTFKYGVTIPVEAQTERMRTIGKGGKASVTILFGTEELVVAEIRRLNNKPGHLQLRYENKAQVCGIICWLFSAASPAAACLKLKRSRR